MTLGDGGPPTPKTANEWVQTNVREAMDARGWTQSELAERLGQSQPWLSKRLTGHTPFQIEDLDALARVFGLSPTEWLCAGYGKWDRRRIIDRRGGADRRRRVADRSPFMHREYPRSQPSLNRHSLH